MAFTQTAAAQFLLSVATYAAICLAWVFFRAADFGTATRLLRAMFGGHAHGDAVLSTREMLQVGIVTVCTFLVHWSLRDTSLETAVARLPQWVIPTAWAGMAMALIITQGNSNAFIYFQF